MFDNSAHNTASAGTTTMYLISVSILQPIFVSAARLTIARSKNHFARLGKEMNGIIASQRKWKSCQYFPIVCLDYERIQILHSMTILSPRFHQWDFELPLSSSLCVCQWCVDKNDWNLAWSHDSSFPWCGLKIALLSSMLSIKINNSQHFICVIHYKTFSTLSPFLVICNIYAVCMEPGNLTNFQINYQFNTLEIC